MSRLAIFGLVAALGLGGVVVLTAASSGTGDECSSPATVAPGAGPDVTIPALIEPPPAVLALRRKGSAFQLATAPAADARTVTGGGSASTECATPTTGSAGGADAAFDPGTIVSDEVFYNSTSMTVEQVRAFLQTENADCPDSNPWCARTMQVTWPAVAADAYCSAIPAGSGDTATAIVAVSTACKINPQVMLVTWQKESGGLDDTSPTASSWNSAWGWHCPDSGPVGSANCDPAYGGFVNQLTGMARQWAKYRVEIPNGMYNYGIGTYEILWNVIDTGCGGAPITITNVATASLYVYTPYQPNEASLAAFPGTGDRCSSYGNRNFFRMFQTYFGDTGGGFAESDGVQPISQPGAPGSGAGGPLVVTYSGNFITIPNHPNIVPALYGQQIMAPNPKVAAAIADGMTWIGTPYSWGGGTPNGPTLGLCDASNGAPNDCHVVGFDCSGLTEYVAAKWGTRIPETSRPQRDPSKGVAWSQAQPGDLIGSEGHITLYIGSFDGQRYQLEAPNSGAMVQISAMRRTDDVVYRYWSESVSV